jgi:hypothetical protein
MSVIIGLPMTLNLPGEIRTSGYIHHYGFWVTLNCPETFRKALPKRRHPRRYVLKLLENSEIVMTVLVV